MLHLKDGPVEGTYACKRAPLYLRGVAIEVGVNRRRDVLDQLSDTPRPPERVYVYRRVGEVGQVHLHGRNVSGWYAVADYEHMPDVDGELLRDNAAWQAWAKAQP